jgi:hypothetical protein
MRHLNLPTYHLSAIRLPGACLVAAATTAATVVVIPVVTEMGRFIWITQRNHSSLQIQAARLAHIPL